MNLQEEVELESRGPEKTFDERYENNFHINSCEGENFLLH